MSARKNKDPRWLILKKMWISYKIIKGKAGHGEIQKGCARKIVELSRDLGIEESKIPVFKELE